MSSYLYPTQESWLRRNARTILAVLSALGILLTGYLTINKLTEQKAAFCGTSGGCDLVLSSKWASLLGIPTAALGLAGFVAVLVLALVPDSIPVVKRWRWPALFTATTAMIAFELYMVYVMAFELKQFCFYCATAIALVIGLWGITLAGNRWLDRGQMGFYGVLLALLTLVSTHAIYVSQPTPPSRLAVAVANQLKAIDGKMYGAHWCPHCIDQKELFGTAFATVPYVECSPNGGPGTDQAQICKEKQIMGYPTWIIDGITYRKGVLTLEELAKITNLESSEDSVTGEAQPVPVQP